MYNVLLIIGFLCVMAVPVLTAFAVMRLISKKSVKILVHGIIMLIMFAIMSFILSFLLMRAGS